MVEKKEEIPEGCYWVRFEGNREWDIGCKFGRGDCLTWNVVGSDELFDTENFEEIGERIERQEKYKNKKKDRIKIIWTRKK